MIRLTASQAAASAAWGQTWEIRIPVCSAIDSGEVNLAWEEMWEVEKGVKLSSSPDGADCQIEEEIVKPEGQQLRCCTLRRRGRSWPRQGRGWRRAGEPGQRGKSSLTFDFLIICMFSIRKFLEISTTFILTGLTFCRNRSEEFARCCLL